MIKQLNAETSKFFEQILTETSTDFTYQSNMNIRSKFNKKFGQLFTSNYSNKSLAHDFRSEIRQTSHLINKLAKEFHQGNKENSRKKNNKYKTHCPETRESFWKARHDLSIEPESE